jgi:hypothetical protein
MSIYYKTCFYSNIYDADTVIVVLGTLCNIIGQEEIDQGFITRNKLLERFGEIIKSDYVNENSYVIEYMWMTIDLPNITYSETHRLYII